MHISPFEFDPKRYVNAVTVDAGRTAYRAQEREINDRLKADLFAHHEVRGPMAEWAWNHAWAEGHAAGRQEVVACFDELVYVIRLAVQAGAKM